MIQKYARSQCTSHTRLTAVAQYKQPFPLIKLYFSTTCHPVANLIVVIKKFKLRKNKLHEVKRERKPPVESEHRGPTLLELQQATTVIIKAVQQEVYADEFKLQHQIRTAEGNHGVCTNVLKHMIKRSTLYHLKPFIDDDGILRVGGRLRRSKLEYREKHPVLMPKKHHVTRLIVRHYHLQVHHQGRLMTHGAIRQTGYWLVNENQVVSNELNSCVTCKRLRERPLEQQMADLPNDRMEETAPVTYVGFDVFGPWSIQFRNTRGAAATSKRWGLLLTCLNSRAVHIEVLESMDSRQMLLAFFSLFTL